LHRRLVTRRSFLGVALKRFLYRCTTLYLPRAATCLNWLFLMKRKSSFSTLRNRPFGLLIPIRYNGLIDFIVCCSLSQADPFEVRRFEKGCGLALLLR
jgi:hypothetical protein